METLIAQSPINEAQKLIKDMSAKLEANGETLDLGNWLTIARYCKKFNIDDTHIVSNWIKRGKIPAENIREIKELNGLKLIKAIVYKYY